MKIKRFEDIVAWQEARKSVKAIYFLSKANKQFLQDLRFRSQITSAAVSIMSNIAEGFSRQTDKEFKQYLFTAKGSASEVQSLLYVALDLNYISETEFKELYVQLDKIARLLSKFISYLS